MAPLLALERTTSLLQSDRWRHPFYSVGFSYVGRGGGGRGAFLCGICITRSTCQRSSFLVTSVLAALWMKPTASCVNTYAEWLLHAVAVTVFHIGILHSFEYATFMVGHHVNVLNPGCTEVTTFFNECNSIVLLIVQTLTQYLFTHI